MGSKERVIEEIARVEVGVAFEEFRSLTPILLKHSLTLTSSLDDVYWNLEFEAVDPISGLFLRSCLRMSLLEICTEVHYGIKQVSEAMINAYNYNHQ